MNKFTFITISAIIGQATSMFVGALPAFANSGADVSIASLRQARNGSNFKVQGLLTCNMGTENNGQGCALRIKDKETGKVFNLSNSTDAMRLYVAGTTNVAIEGKLADSDTVQIGTVSAL